MKVGDSYKCIESYFYNGTLYFLKGREYKIKEFEDDVFERDLHEHIHFEKNEQGERNMFIFSFEMPTYFTYLFKFGK